MTRFQIIAAGATEKNRGLIEKKQPRRFGLIETALRAVLIDQLTRGQRFWEVVYFTGVNVRPNTRR